MDLIYCRQCRHFGTEPYSSCHRHPPTIVLWDGEPTSRWPEVREDDWCSQGETEQQKAERLEQARWMALARWEEYLALNRRRSDAGWKE
jgi:hypothetical protein